MTSTSMTPDYESYDRWDVNYRGYGSAPGMLRELAARGYSRRQLGRPKLNDPGALDMLRRMLDKTHRRPV